MYKNDGLCSDRRLDVLQYTCALMVYMYMYFIVKYKCISAIQVFFSAVTKR